MFHYCSTLLYSSREEICGATGLNSARYRALWGFKHINILTTFLISNNKTMGAKLDKIYEDVILL